MIICCGIILLYTVKICHLDWFNKKLNGQELGRVFRRERTLGRRKEIQGVASQMEKKQGGHIEQR